MMTHSSRSAKLQTVYLWRAWQSEPGMDGAIYRATLTTDAPARPDAVHAHPGLVYQESVYDDWHLIGTCTGFLAEIALPGYEGPAETVVENRDGRQWSIEDIIRGGRFRAWKG